MIAICINDIDIINISDFFSSDSKNRFRIDFGLVFQKDGTAQP